MGRRAQRIPSWPGVIHSNKGRIHLRRPTCDILTIRLRQSGGPYIPVSPSSRRNNLLTAAETDPACSILPRAPHGVTRDSCSVFLASGEQFPSNQPAHRSLRRTLRKSNRLGQLLITHLNGSLPTCLFGRKPYIDKEAGGSPVVADQVAHQHVYDVIIQVQHGYTGQ